MDGRVRSLSVGEQRTRVLDVGIGDPVVLLHGWGGRIESMISIVRCLSDRYRILALDLPGFGEAPIPHGVWGTPDHAEYVADVLAEVGVARAHVIGHSFGAKTALYLAATHPELVDKLVLIASNGIRRSPDLRARALRGTSRAARAVGCLGGPGRRVRDAIYRRVASDDYRAAGPLRPMLVKTVNEDFSHLLRLVKSPTLLVWGTSDDAVPVADAHRMQALIPDAGVVLFEGAGHFCYLEQPQRFCRVVRHFLSGS